MPLSNDERGWVMTALSGIACIFGASFICVDIIVRQFPGKRDFRIQDSDAFLSTSLSLSFGVMLFSALYTMLPSSKRSLQEGGYSAKEATWIMVACFVGGVVGISIASNVLHRYVPHDVVDCEHTHEEDAEGSKADEDSHDHYHHDPHDSQSDERPPNQPRVKSAASQRRSSFPDRLQRLSSGSKVARQTGRGPGHTADPDSTPTTEHETSQIEHRSTRPARPDTAKRTHSLQQRISAGLSSLNLSKDPSCKCNGACYGFSEICGPECFKNINSRGGRNVGPGSRPHAARDATATETTPLLHGIPEEELQRPHTEAGPEGLADRRQHLDAEHLDVQPPADSSGTLRANGDDLHDLHKAGTQDTEVTEATEHNHHHHVPQNAFLSIGLQTSIAIALHKLPEGFITYATNHANPKLGVSVFLALFIHNITEGFALALPLYLAINNRAKAMLISFFLGGLSQPLGAGVAALWFKLAGTSNWAPSEAVYGGMFAVTAGIMASVALQLFSESLDLTHSKMLCMVGAFTGMTILGISNALTA